MNTIPTGIVSQQAFLSCGSFEGGSFWSRSRSYSHAWASSFLKSTHSHTGVKTLRHLHLLQGKVFRIYIKKEKNFKRLAAELVGSNDCLNPPRKGEEDQIQHFATLEENSSFLLKNKQLKAPCTVVSPATTQVGQIEVFASIKEQKDSISIQFSGVFCSNAPNNRLAGRSRLAKKLYSARWKF